MRTLTAFLCVTAIAGCQLLPPDGPSSLMDRPLTGVTWELSIIENAKGAVIFQPEADQTYFVRFEDDGSLTGQNACNACGGEYEAAGQTITIVAPCTEAACETPTPYLGYGDALNHATGYDIEDGKLHLRVTTRSGDEQTFVHVPRQE